MATIDFDSSYLGVPPWDIGGPQPEIARLADRGEIQGDVLDVGCGTGENAIYLSRLGRRVVGIDSSSNAIKKAEARAEQLEVDVTFLVEDALELHTLNRIFDSIIDSGLFHGLTDDGRLRFTKSLLSVLAIRGKYFMICFSDEEPKDWGGPRRITKAEIRETFQLGWKIDYINEGLFKTNIHDNGGKAWISSITKT